MFSAGGFLPACASACEQRRAGRLQRSPPNGRRSSCRAPPRRPGGGGPPPARRRVRRRPGLAHREQPAQELRFFEPFRMGGRRQEGAPLRQERLAGGGPVRGLRGLPRRVRPLRRRRGGLDDLVRHGKAEERLRLDREEPGRALRQEGRGHQGRGLVRPRARRDG